MEEFYQALEKAIKISGYEGPVNGQDIYDELCDEIEDKEPGAYIFMSKKNKDTFFEYRIQVFKDQFNLSTIDINTPDRVYHVDFD